MCACALSSACLYTSFLQCTYSFRIPDRRLPLRLNWILPSSGLLRSVGWFRTDVSGLSVPSSRVSDTWPWKMGPICGPATSVLDQPTLRNDPEDGQIHFVFLLFYSVCILTSYFIFFLSLSNIRTIYPKEGNKYTEWMWQGSEHNQDM